MIAQASLDDERLKFDYAARGGEESGRLVEPHRLGSPGRRWYLVAWDFVEAQIKARPNPPPDDERRHLRLARADPRRHRRTLRGRAAFGVQKSPRRRRHPLLPGFRRLASGP
ncbi:WYL domain-containing protein [Amycolatopsis sp. cmx-11-51]|uniref:WYL domain-containing protein n=1 Tax=unclassified Amycolatopsis TaxID=2618356 RepID=UPI0039E5B339